MKKRDRAEAAFLHVFSEHQANGTNALYAFELLMEARKIPSEPTALHRVGNAILQLAGKDPRPYYEGYSFQLYPTLRKLENDGLVESDWFIGPLPEGQEYRRRVYRLSED